MYEVHLLWDNHAMRKSKQTHAKAVWREKFLVSPHLFQLIQMRYQTRDFKKPLWLFIQHSWAFRWLQPQPPPDCSCIRDPKRELPSWVSHRTVKLIINCYFKPLKLGVVCSTIIENQNSPLWYMLCSLWNVPPLSYPMYHSYLLLSKTFCLVWFRGLRGVES